MRRTWRTQRRRLIAGIAGLAMGLVGLRNVSPDSLARLAAVALFARIEPLP
jgi:hypothetical protein